MNNLKDTSRELRGKMDGSDSFMVGGHQISKIRRISRKVPAWAKNDERIKALLSHSFPRLNKQPTGAARWVRVIYLYFRMKMTRGQIAEEMSLTYKTVDNIILRITYAADNRSCNTGSVRMKR